MNELLRYCYAILEADPSMSADELKSQYRKLVKIWHPDINSAPDARVRFERIQKAYTYIVNYIPPIDLPNAPQSSQRTYTRPSSYPSQVRAKAQYVKKERGTLKLEFVGFHFGIIILGILVLAIDLFFWYIGAQFIAILVGLAAVSFIGLGELLPVEINWRKFFGLFRTDKQLRDNTALVILLVLYNLFMLFTIMPRTDFPFYIYVLAVILGYRFGFVLTPKSLASKVKSILAPFIIILSFQLLLTANYFITWSTQHVQIMNNDTDLDTDKFHMLEDGSMINYAKIIAIVHAANTHPDANILDFQISRGLVGINVVKSIEYK